MEYEGVGFHGFTLPDGSFWAYREPEAGEISFELQIRCRTQGTAPGDLYDGYVSLNLLDFTTGAA